MKTLWQNAALRAWGGAFTHPDWPQHFIVHESDFDAIRKLAEWKQSRHAPPSENPSVPSSSDRRAE